MGRLAETDALLSRAIDIATATGDTRAAAHARIFQVHLHHHLQPETWVEETHRVAAEVIAIFTATGDELGLARAWRLLCVADQNDPVASAAAVDRALFHARRAGDPRELGMAMIDEAVRLVASEVHVTEALPRTHALLETAQAIGRGVAADIALSVAMLEAMSGDAETARRRCAEGLQIQRDLGLSMDFAFGVIGAALVHRFADEPAVSEAYLREGLDGLHGTGDVEVSAFLAG